MVKKILDEINEVGIGEVILDQVLVTRILGYFAKFMAENLDSTHEDQTTSLLYQILREVQSLGQVIVDRAQFDADQQNLATAVNAFSDIFTTLATETEQLITLLQAENPDFSNEDSVVAKASATIQTLSTDAASLKQTLDQALAQSQSSIANAPAAPATTSGTSTPTNPGLVTETPAPVTTSDAASTTAG